MISRRLAILTINNVEHLSRHAITSAVEQIHYSTPLPSEKDRATLTNMSSLMSSENIYEIAS